MFDSMLLRAVRYMCKSLCIVRTSGRCNVRPDGHVQKNQRGDAAEGLAWRLLFPGEACLAFSLWRSSSRASCTWPVVQVSVRTLFPTQG
jgi:hypothetical protein